MKTKISIAAALVVTVLFLAGCQSSAQGAPVHIGENAATTITLDEAQNIALENAGVTADTVTNLHVITDEDDGKLQYEVDFRHGDYEYEYEIDAATGKITSRSRDYEAVPPVTEPPVTEPPATEPPATEPPTTKPVTDRNITEKKAKSIALEHAKLKESAVSNLRIKLEKDDGVTYYDVDFRKGDYEYSYEIHATTGKIIEWDKDHEPTKPVVSTDPPPTEPPTTEPPATKPSENKNITEKEAKKIALDHAKLKEADVSGLRTELDKDDGITYFDVEFRNGIYEYSYEINAVTGKIIEWDKDIDD